MKYTYGTLMHYGILGMKWGVRRYQNPDGTYTPAGKKRYSRVFVSGSSKTEFPDSGYYRKDLPKAVSDELDAIMNDDKTVLIGDAPGIDRQVQKYLASKGYLNVEVYGPGNEKVRYSANSKWKSQTIDNPNAEPGSSEWLSAKDKVMSDLADEGLAVILDNGSSATRANIQRLVGSGKSVKVYELSAKGSDQDRWVYDIEPKVSHSEGSDEMTELKHYGILGMKWGVRRYQNKDGTLTEAGKRRYARDVAENKAKKKENRIDIDGPDPNRWVKEDLLRSKNVLDAGSSLVGNTKKIVGQIRSKDARPTRMDLSDKTDNELRQRINRELLEQQYNQLFNNINSKTESSGKQKVADMLDAAGDALAFGSTALSLALLIKQLRG